MEEKGVCLVTGGASGIGFSTAGELIGDGWRVALLDVQDDKLAAAQERLGSNSRAVSLDIKMPPP